MTTATEIRERPIIFGAPMVNALLAGRKTQTRREVKFRSAFAFPHVAYKCVWEHPGGGWVFADTSMKPHGWQPQKSRGMQCPYGVPDDRLWVRETWVPFAEASSLGHGMGRPVYRATWPPSLDERHDAGLLKEPNRWRSPILMPRWASRLTLEITNVRVERLQDISEADATAEGVPSKLINDPMFKSDAREWWSPLGYCATARQAFAHLWNDINGHNSWNANPWVWVVEFKRVNP